MPCFPPLLPRSSVLAFLSVAFQWLCQDTQKWQALLGRCSGAAVGMEGLPGELALMRSCAHALISSLPSPPRAPCGLRRAPCALLVPVTANALRRAGGGELWARRLAAPQRPAPKARPRQDGLGASASASAWGLEPWGLWSEKGRLWLRILFKGATLSAEWGNRGKGRQLDVSLVPNPLDVSLKR